MLRVSFKSVMPVLAVLSIASASQALTLKMEYDVTNPASWTGSTLADTQSFGSAMTPGAGGGGAGFGAPTYVASGAGLQNRAYLNFTQLGVLGYSNRDGASFNNPGPLAQGYTMEGYFRINSATLAVSTNTAIGSSQGTSFENQFLYVRGGDNYLASETQIRETTGSQTFFSSSIGLGAYIPMNTWFHLVKVMDTSSNNDVRYYVNGTLVATDTGLPDTTTYEYWSRGENWGNVGSSGREVRGVDYSLTRFYQGAMTAQEVTARYAAVALPEPASLSLLALGGLALLKRQRKP